MQDKNSIDNKQHQLWFYIPCLLILFVSTIFRVYDLISDIQFGYAVAVSVFILSVMVFYWVYLGWKYDQICFRFGITRHTYLYRYREPKKYWFYMIAYFVLACFTLNLSFKIPLMLD